MARMGLLERRAREKIMSKNDIWNFDRICDLSLGLSQANSLWDKQAFTVPTARRTLEIISVLESVEFKLGQLITDLRNSLK